MAAPTTAVDIPALLTDPDYCGTLAAARDLGRRGVRVETTAPFRFSITSSSRYVARHWKGPRGAPERQVRWLEELGCRRFGAVLYPTNDTHAWLLALHARRLQAHFRMYSPDITAVENVLDKRRLYEACAAVGIDIPVTYFAEDPAQVAAAAERARFPLLLKQRTQILSTGSKGEIVRQASDLPGAYQRFAFMNQHAPEVHKRMPFASWPMMQEFHAGVRTSVYVISGFVNRNHSQFVAHAAAKMLQYPRTLGLSLCLRDAPLDVALGARVLDLCRHTGYFGVFQIEFLVEGDRLLLIDFNPRYHHWMAYDIACGLPLPWLVHLAACADEYALTQAMEDARIATGVAGRKPLYFAYGMQLAEMLLFQRMTGAMSNEEARFWQQWRVEYADSIIDAVADVEDRGPQRTAWMANWGSHLRHPRSFIQQIVFDRR